MNQPFDEVLDLYLKGQIISAWKLGRSAGELEDWPAPGARILAGRLASHLGNERLAGLLQIRAFRAHPQDREAQYYFVTRVHRRRGALAAWEQQTALGAPRGDELGPYEMYHGQRACILADLRDFASAERHLREAAATRPERAWFYVERSYVSQREDRVAEALEAAEHALVLSPWYPPAISAIAQCMHVVDRTDEAIDLLKTKCKAVQSSLLVVHLVTLLSDTGRMDDAEAWLSRYEELTPIRDENASAWMGYMRVTLAQQRADYATALHHAEAIDEPLFKTIAGNIRSFLQDAEVGAPCKKLLDVPYVRQHHQTCSPATLSALSQFWQRPVEHLAVAESICYDGTPMHSERRWAEEQGFYVREFRVDWPSTVKLIDLGVPFTLVVSEAVYSHLQAVVGYDSALGIIFIRDPQQQSLVMADARHLYEAQESVGPRGMAMVPMDRRHSLAGLELPESDLYDLYHAMQMALEVHDRDEALARLHDMEQIDAAHRLTLTARRALATYDDDIPAVLEVIDALHERFPRDPALRLARLHILRQVSTREYRLIWLDEMVRQGPGDPMLLMEYATDLASDDREVARAMWYLRRAIRRRPDDPPVIHALAESIWTCGRREEAIPYYRFAACLSETSEGFSNAYFTASRSAGQTDSALAFLRGRFELLGSRSSLPARSLFVALEQLDRTEDAFTVLDEAHRLRPDDGDLLLFAAMKRAQWGETERARHLLAEAEGRVKRTQWLAAAAEQARCRGDRAAALDLWREIAKVEVLNVGAHQMIAFLLAESGTRDAALAHLRSICGVFPHHAGLHHLLYEWTMGDSAAEREAVLRHLLSIDPADAWSHRELALNLRRQSRFEEALEAVNEALELDSRHAAGYTIKGHVLVGMGRLDEATACYHTAVRTWADAPGAIHGLLDTYGDTAEKRKEVLEMVESQLLQQPAVGDGFLTFREVARAVLTPTELLDSFERAHRERPDLWQVWSVLTQHLTDMGRVDEALHIAREATQRFPRLPRTWLDLARVHEIRLEPEQQIDALSHCRELNPDWPEPIAALCAALERKGRQQEAACTLESAILRTPLGAALRGQLAGLHNRAGNVDRAIETITAALNVNPDYEEGWQQLAVWSAGRGDTKTPIEMATQLAEARPGESVPWVRLAVIQMESGELEAALQSLGRAVAIDPRATEAHDHRACALTQMRRYRDAELACTPPVFGDATPLPLRGRAAWVDAQRGDYTKAIANMTLLLEQHPDYEWGWHQLMEWHAQRGRLREAMDAAERLAWLDPTDMVAQGWLGDMKRKLRDVSGAKRIFRRAMEFQPGYLFAGFQLFEIQLKEKDIEEAERTLEILSMHAPREEVLAARVELEITRDRRHSALELMRELVAAPISAEASLERAAAAFWKRRWHRPLERLLRKVMRTSEWHPAVAELWAGSSAQRGRFGGVLRYRYLVKLGAPGRRAVNRVLMELGDKGQSIDPTTTEALRFRWHIRLIRWICRSWRSDDLFWGNVGYALLCLRRYRSVIRWMHGWESRENVEYWMLQNLTVALLRKRNDRAAREVLRFIGRDLTPTQDVSAYLKTWCALGACLDEDWDLASRLLHEAPADLLTDKEKPLRGVAQTALEVLQVPRGTEPLSDEAKLKIRMAVDAFASNFALRRVINLVRIKIGRHTGQWRLTLDGWLGAYRRPLAISVAVVAVILYILWKIIPPGTAVS